MKPFCNVKDLKTDFRMSYVVDMEDENHNSFLAVGDDINVLDSVFYLLKDKKYKGKFGSKYFSEQSEEWKEILKEV